MTAAAAVERWTVGDVRISRVVEMAGPVPGTFLFADATAERVAETPAWLRPHFVDARQRLLSSVHAFVIESDGRRIVVDTCVGNDKVRPNAAWNQRRGSFVADLTAAGFHPDTIDTVLCTHLHVDHVGWNTTLVDGRWVPTFPRARYLFARTEWEHWRNDPVQRDGDIVGDSVQPIVDAGLADLVEPTHALTAEVRLEPTPGHTPGHVSVHVTSQGAEAVITGDLMHHPVQCARPDWGSNFDVDASAARATRRAFFARYADRPVLILGTHFATPTAGHLHRDGDVWRFAV